MCFVVTGRSQSAAVVVNVAWLVAERPKDVGSGVTRV